LIRKYVVDNLPVNLYLSVTQTIIQNKQSNQNRPGVKSVPNLSAEAASVKRFFAARLNWAKKMRDLLRDDRLVGFLMSAHFKARRKDRSFKAVCPSGCISEITIVMLI
jgi:hypothetical protein